MKTFAHTHRPFIALALLCVGACFLALIGAVMTRQAEHFYLVWNLFLGVIPVGLALAVQSLEERGRLAFAGVLTVVWLLFLPNAPYILTDFIHLIRTPRVWAWGHLVALVWFSFAALMAGLLSLRVVHGVVENRYGTLMAWVFVSFVSFLTGIGVALGRFHRWNSWDALRDPRQILTDAFHHVPVGSTPSVEVLFPWAFGAFFGLAYVFVWSLTPRLAVVPQRV